MAQLLPSALTNAIDELGRLPGVGARTAERYVGHNWIVKGKNGQTNGYVKLEFR